MGQDPPPPPPPVLMYFRDDPYEPVHEHEPVPQDAYRNFKCKTDVSKIVEFVLETGV